MRKVIVASMVGTTIEWFDFFLYASVAALVFGKLFFPSADPLAGTLLALSTFAVGFIARPFGGLIFGHIGDRLGRKRTLVLTLLMMGGATLLIGLLPTHATIGVAAPILLVVLRIVQGLALGGEWGGAALMVVEHGHDSRSRGFYGSWPNSAAPAGFILAAGSLSIISALTSAEAFEAWGWRLPFLFSALLVLFGLYIRVSLDESPLFRAVEKTETRARMPAVELFRTSAPTVLGATGAALTIFVAFYVFSVFVLTYATSELDMSRTYILNICIVAQLAYFVAIPLWGAISDRIGRRIPMMIGAAGIGAWGFAFFPLLESGSTLLVALAPAVGLFIVGAMYGPQAAFFAELFGTRVRYTGASLSYQLAGAIAGGFTPIVAVALLDRYDSTLAISIFMLAVATVSFLVIAVLSETYRRHLEERSEEEREGERRMVEDVELARVLG